MDRRGGSPSVVDSSRARSNQSTSQRGRSRDVDSSPATANGAQRSRLDSQKTKKDYYPTIDEMIKSDDEALTKLFASMNKGNVVCLLRETLSQLRCAKKQNEKVGSTVMQIGLEVHEIQRKMETSMEGIINQDSIVHAIEP